MAIYVVQRWGESATTGDPLKRPTSMSQKEELLCTYLYVQAGVLKAEGMEQKVVVGCNLCFDSQSICSSIDLPNMVNVRILCCYKLI